MMEILFYQQSPFRLFGLSHVIGIVIGLFFFIYTPKVLKKLSPTTKTTIGKALGILCFLFFPIHLAVYYFYLGLDPKYDFPILQLCGVSVILLGLSLTFHLQKLFKLSYVLTLTAVSLSFILPDLGVDFPHVYYAMFWGSHYLMAIALAFLQSTFEVKFEFKDLWQVEGFLVLYALVVYPINVYLDANYGFIRHRPHNFSFVDDWGFWFTNPVSYILILNLIFLGVFLLTNSITKLAIKNHSETKF